MPRKILNLGGDFGEMMTATLNSPHLEDKELVVGGVSAGQDQSSLPLLHNNQQYVYSHVFIESSPKEMAGTD